jgi:hypothetical protein
VSLVEFVEAVDQFILVNKVPIGIDVPPTWRPGPRTGERRLMLPLEIAGEQSGHRLMLQAFPEHDLQPNFNIGLVCFDKVVDRLDFEPGATHGNNLLPNSLPGVVHGPHWHKWELNRGQVRSIQAYDRLPFAIAYDGGRQFDAVLRAYGHERNILITKHSISLPPRVRLV